MKISNLRRAFTLIELLLVVSIIAIVGISAISGFAHLIDSQDGDTVNKIIVNTISSLDRSVFNHKIISYDATFKSGSLGFVVNLDTYKKNTPLLYSFDFVTGSGQVNSNDTGTGQGILYFTAQDSVEKTIVIDMSGGIQPFSLPRGMQKKWYQISGASGDKNLNSFIIQYYNLTNTSNSPVNEVQLIGIKGLSGGMVVSYSTLGIQNTLGKKMLLGHTGSNIYILEKATLTFEKNGKEIQVIFTP